MPPPEQPPDLKITPRPTNHLPGSPGKVQVLHDRCWAGESLWHPQDAERDDEGDPVNLQGVARLFKKVFTKEEEEDGEEA